MFEKYPNYDALDSGWRRSSDEIVDWLAATLPDDARVLSVGCDLGFMEQRLWRLYGERIELYVQDYASQALQWLRQVLPTERIHQVGVLSGNSISYIFTPRITQWRKTIWLPFSSYPVNHYVMAVIS